MALAKPQSTLSMYMWSVVCGFAIKTQLLDAGRFANVYNRNSCGPIASKTALSPLYELMLRFNNNEHTALSSAVQYFRCEVFMHAVVNQCRFNRYSYVGTTTFIWRISSSLARSSIIALRPQSEQYRYQFKDWVRISPRFGGPIIKCV